MILGMGVPELLVILLVTVIIFGPKNLPKLGTALGQTVKNVREGMEEEPSQDPDQAGQDVKVENSESSVSSSTVSAEFVTCPNCESKVPADSDFCPHCGTKLER